MQRSQPLGRTALSALGELAEGTSFRHHQARSIARGPQVRAPQHPPQAFRGRQDLHSRSWEGLVRDADAGVFLTSSLLLGWEPPFENHYSSSRIPSVIGRTVRLNSRGTAENTRVLAPNPAQPKPRARRRPEILAETPAVRMSLACAPHPPSVFRERSRARSPQAFRGNT